MGSGHVLSFLFFSYGVFAIVSLKGSYRNDNLSEIAYPIHLLLVKVYTTIIVVFVREITKNLALLI